VQHAGFSRCEAREWAGDDKDCGIDLSCAAKGRCGTRVSCVDLVLTLTASSRALTAEGVEQRSSAAVRLTTAGSGCAGG
jgi:hypothetical protein